MEQMMTIINVLAFVLTVIGTCITIWQAHNAQNSAEVAENAKQTILERKQLHIYDDILSKAHEVEGMISMWKSNKSTKKGLNISKDRQKVDMLISLVNEQKQNINNERKDIDYAQNQLVKHLENFSEDNPNLTDALNKMHEAVRTITRIVSGEKQAKEYK